jgi:hypothetical protein
MFKKVAIENDYTFIEEHDDGWVTYAIGHDGDDEAGMWFEYNKNDDGFYIVYSYPTHKISYNIIVKYIEAKCKYYDIVTIDYSDIGKVDYVCYSCSESEYRGKIGFVFDKEYERGLIKHFPDI